MKHPRDGKRVTVGPLEITAQPSSGAGFHKGDWRGSYGRWLIEAKRTERQSLSVKRVWWEKIAAEARACGRLPMLLLTFAGAGRQQHLLCIDPRHLPRLVEDLSNADEQE